MWWTAVLLAVAFPSVVLSQQVPDMFSCIDPARLAPRTLEYRSGEYKDQWTVSPVTVDGRTLVRVIKRRTRGGLTTVEHTIDLDATSLAPVTFRIMSAERGLTSDLVLRGNQLTGHLLGTTVSVSTGEGPVLIGAMVDNVLVAAVDWGRCANVNVKSFGLLGKVSDVSFTRVGEPTLAISGRELPVYEVLRAEGKYRRRMFVTKSAPFVVAKIEYDPDTSMELVGVPR